MKRNQAAWNTHARCCLSLSSAQLSSVARGTRVKWMGSWECSSERASSQCQCQRTSPAATEKFPRLDQRHPSTHGPWVMDPWSIPLPPERRQIDREGKERRGGQCGRGWRPNLPPEDAVRTTDGYERAAPRRAHGGRDSHGFPACADARARGHRRPPVARCHRAWCRWM